MPDKWWKTPRYLLGGLAFLFVLAVYLLRLDSMAGMFIDDGWYILLGKALATAHGYTLINSPSPGIMPEYPPAFPGLLSIVFRVYPSFPANVWLLKLPSILSLLITGALVYYYLVRVYVVDVRIALGVTLLTLLNPALVFLATSTLMSEVFFIFLQMATLVFVERSLSASSRRMAWMLVAMSAALASLTFLTRSVAVGLLLAVVVYYFLKKRAPYALVFLMVVCVIVGPWLYYKKQHAPTPEQVFEQKGYIMQTYAASFWQKSAGGEDSGTITYKELPKRVLDALTEVFGRNIGGLVLPFFYRSSAESGMEVFGMTGDMGMATDAMIISSILGGLCVVGLIIVLRRKLVLAELLLLFTLPIILTWPWPTFRYLLPFTPFIFLYLITGLNGVRAGVSRLLKRSKQTSEHTNHSFSSPVRILLVVVVLLIVYEHLSYIAGRFGLAGQPPVLTRSWERATELTTWMRNNLKPDAVVATENPALVHLLTGLKTVSTSTPARNEELLARKATHIAHISTFFAPPVSATSNKEQILFETNDLHFFVYRLR